MKFDAKMDMQSEKEALSKQWKQLTADDFQSLSSVKSSSDKEQNSTIKEQDKSNQTVGSSPSKQNQTALASSNSSANASVNSSLKANST